MTICAYHNILKRNIYLWLESNFIFACFVIWLVLSVCVWVCLTFIREHNKWKQKLFLCFQIVPLWKYCILIFFIKSPGQFTCWPILNLVRAMCNEVTSCHRIQWIGFLYYILPTSFPWYLSTSGLFMSFNLGNYNTNDIFKCEYFPATKTI